MPSEDAAPTDRRVLRGQRNREAVVTAVLELLHEGNLTPTAAEIAARAGLSLRSIYHHFDDLESLQLAVADQALSGLIDVLQPIPTDGNFNDRLVAFVAQRSQQFERTMPVFRASRLTALSSPKVTRLMTFSHEFLRAEIAQTFAIELRGATEWQLDALDAVCSIDGWVRLRVDQGLSIELAQVVMSRAIEAILDP